jgi:hypothetical protein
MATTENESNADQAVVKTAKVKAKLKKVLPTDRVAVARQFDILRGYAAASGLERKPVSNEDVAKVVNIHAGSVSNCNPFFLDAGMISREKNGNVPADEVFAFSDKSQWSQEKATHKLAPLIRKTWFCLTLLPKLAFRPLPMDQAVEFLADEAGAGPEYKDQLSALIDYLKFVGIVSVEGNTVALVKGAEDAKNLDHMPPGAGNAGNGKGMQAALPDGEVGRTNQSRDQASHHPFIAGLLRTLPDPESEWSMAGRVKWLQTASNVFGLMYRTKDDDDVEYIEITKKAL